MKNMPARNARRDTNEQDIVDALVAAGASVARIGRDGVPDLLVGYLGETYLLEVKREAGPRGGTKGKKLNAKQQAFWKGWKGRAPVLVRTVGDALVAIGRSHAEGGDGHRGRDAVASGVDLGPVLIGPKHGRCCALDLGGSHYHCGTCGAVSGMQGCGDGYHANGK